MGEKINFFKVFFFGKLFVEEVKHYLLFRGCALLCFYFHENHGKEALVISALAYACRNGKEDPSW